MASSSDNPSDGKDLHIPLPYIYHKPNILTPENFVTSVELSGMSNALCPRYLVPHFLSVDCPHPIFFPHEDNVTIYQTHIK